MNSRQRWLVGMVLCLLLFSVLPAIQPAAHAQESEWYGVISSRPVAGAAVPWVVGGRIIPTTEATRLDEDHGRLVVGACASVLFAEGVAVRIASESPRACPRSGGISGLDLSSDVVWVGLISQRPVGDSGDWIIGGLTFFATSSTLLDQDDAPLVVGSCAAVEFAGGIALRIEGKPTGVCSISSVTTGEYGQWYGVISSRPASIDGTWFFGGRAFVATRGTRINQEYGPLTEGTCALVTYQGELALEIKRELGTSCGL
jgi:hypothetical protein